MTNPRLQRDQTLPLFARGMNIHHRACSHRVDRVDYRVLPVDSSLECRVIQENTSLYIIDALSLLLVLGMDTTLAVVSAAGAPFPNLTDIVVGGASDVIVTVRCVATPAGSVEWSYGGNSSVVTSGLTPFGVSQEDGVLRIYPASLLDQEDQYTCRNGTQMDTVSVQFRLGKNKNICTFSYSENENLY